MNTQRFIPWMSLAALFTAIVLLTASEMRNFAAASAPASLVGHTWAITDSNGESTMRFFSNNRYEITSATETETGYYTPRLNGNAWQVAATKIDGSITRQYTFTFDSLTGGQVTVLVPGARTSGTFQQANVPSAALTTMNVTNEVSLAGPSFYKIDFAGSSTGTFKISLPGYGSGIFNYTPTPNSARLVLTYTNADIAGDIDDLNLQFRASSGSSVVSRHTGSQVVSGQTNPISGTFTFTVQ